MIKPSFSSIITQLEWVGFKVKPTNSGWKVFFKAPPEDTRGLNIIKAIVQGMFPVSSFGYDKASRSYIYWIELVNTYSSHDLDDKIKLLQGKIRAKYLTN